MNRKLTYLSILAVVPLLLLVSTPSLLNTSEAVNTGTTDYTFAMRTQSLVCGDHLCNEHKTVTAVSGENVVMDSPVLHDHLPEIEVVEAHNFRGTDPNAYVVTIKVTAGKENIQNISIQVTSDIETTPSNIGGLFATQDTILVVRIHAMDAGSIHARVLSYQLNN